MTAFPTPPKPPVNASRLQRLLGFRTRLYLTWAALFCLFASFFLSFDLKFSIILDKLPNLVGLHLAPNGFLQGAALTVFLCLCAIVASSILGFVTALGRLSKSAVAFGIASFYASFFRGTPLLIQILLIYLGLPQLGLKTQLHTEFLRHGLGHVNVEAIQLVLLVQERERWIAFHQHAHQFFVLLDAIQRRTAEGLSRGGQQGQAQGQQRLKFHEGHR
jgi:His/Glu/Gln/Arg/opine family amino acid ABC transporter permease subunit